MAGLLLGSRDWLSNNVTVDALAEIQSEAIHSLRCPLHSADSVTNKRAFDQASVRKNSMFIRI